MLPAIIQFCASALIIVVAGTFLSRFADEIAERTGLGRLLIGSVLLAGATSLPELSVDISAVRSGMADLAVGDLIGSSLANLTILAVLDLLSHPRGRLLSRQSARHALSGNVSGALTAVFGISLLAHSVLADKEILGLSYGIWLILLGYILGIRLVYFDQMASRLEAAAEPPAAAHAMSGSWRRCALGFAAAAAAIVVAGPWLSDAAGTIADETGLGRTFVGTTLVAFSTSLPEVAASFSALRMGALDLAIGNVFGSNAFNMVLFVPLDLIHSGPILAAVSQNHGVTCLAVILATQIAVLGQLFNVEKRRPLIEPDALLVLLVTFGSLWLIYRLG